MVIRMVQGQMQMLKVEVEGQGQMSRSHTSPTRPILLTKNTFNW